MNANSEVYNFLDIYQEQHDSNIGHLLQNTGLLLNYEVQILSSFIHAHVFIDMFLFTKIQSKKALMSKLDINDQLIIHF